MMIHKGKKASPFLLLCLDPHTIAFLFKVVSSPSQYQYAKCTYQIGCVSTYIRVREEHSAPQRMGHNCSICADP